MVCNHSPLRRVNSHPRFIGITYPDWGYKKWRRVASISFFCSSGNNDLKGPIWYWYISMCFCRIPENGGCSWCSHLGYIIIHCITVLSTWVWYQHCYLYLRHIRICIVTYFMAKNRSTLTDFFCLVLLILLKCIRCVCVFLRSIKIHQNGRLHKIFHRMALQSL